MIRKRAPVLGALLFVGLLIGSFRRPAPAFPPDVLETSAAMDATGLRDMAHRLRVSVAGGEPVWREAAVMGLRRYGPKAVRLLREEAAREPDAAMRAVFEDVARELERRP